MEGMIATKKMIQNVIDGTTPPQRANTASYADGATNDSEGNNIANTYARQNGTYNDMSVGHASNAGYATSAASATNATNATNATKATQDGNGDVITSTYVKQSALLDLLFPIGSIYMNYENSTSPASTLGGSWTRIYDKFLIGAGRSYTFGTEGGEEFHQLTVAEMPSHTHTIYNTESNSECSAYVPQNGNSLWGSADATFSGWGGVSKGLIQTAGSDTPHNNMPPYRAVWMWRRTA